MTITRVVWVDDDGTRTTGTVLNNAKLQEIYASIESNWLAQTYVPVWGNTGTANSLGNGTLAGKYFFVGKLVFFTITLTWGTSTTSGNGTWTFSMPSSSDAVGTVTGLAIDTGSASYGLRGSNISATVVGMSRDDVAPLVAVAATSPFPWGSTDICIVTGWYFAT